jgi:AraC-like DNA-binding protein
MNAMSDHGALWRRAGSIFRARRNGALVNDLGTPDGRKSVLAFGPFRLFPPQRRLEKDGKPIPAVGRAFDLLVFLLSFYLPRTALEEIAEDVGERAILAVDLGHGRVDDDPVVRSLSDALLPALAEPGRFNMFFVDRLGRARRPEIARCRGAPQSPLSGARGGLAPWQVRRARELLSKKSNGDTPLAQVARECGLSVSHFTRAFRQSLGMAPHQWLLSLRVERAKEQLVKPDASLADIAIECGFADQSHFTRVFTKHVGSSPGHWRRQNASGPLPDVAAKRGLNTPCRDRSGQNAAVSFNSARATVF